MISMHANTSPKHSVYYYGKAETTEKNPMSRLNKGFKKGKYYHREEEEQQQYHRPLLRCEPQAETELRFSNLSANK
jgi:N-acetylmuramoyl-L-alanine amidase